MSAPTHQNGAAEVIGEQVTLPLRGYVGPSDIDSAFGDLEDASQAACLDLREVGYLDVAALMMLVAHVSTRSRVGASTTVRLPDEQRHRDFLRAWDFPRGITAATGVRFVDLVDEADHHWFGETQKYYLPKKVATPYDALMQELVASRFFGMTNYRLAGDQGDVAALEDESNRWRRQALLRTLTDRLHGPVDDIARVHIFELLANVLEHPAASHAAVMSFANFNKRTMRDNLFTLCVWDDGAPIADTLRRTLEQDLELRVEATEAADVFSVKSTQSDRVQEYPVSWTPGRDATDEQLLLASFFPGISQKGAGTDHWFLEVDGKEDLGRGLFNLYKSVIDVFGGSLALRSGRHFANIKAVKRRGQVVANSYQMKLVELPGSASIRGNAFTVRLPLL